MPEAVGQLNMYLNYYTAEINDEDDNPPIGLILCTDKGNVDMQYALGGLSNNIFASITDSINDTYLKINSVSEGTGSYSMFVDLLYSYCVDQELF